MKYVILIGMLSLSGCQAPSATINVNQKTVNTETQEWTPVPGTTACHYQSNPQYDITNDSYYTAVIDFSYTIDQQYVETVTCTVTLTGATFVGYNVSTVSGSSIYNPSDDGYVLGPCAATMSDDAPFSPYTPNGTPYPEDPIPSGINYMPKGIVYRIMGTNPDGAGEGFVLTFAENRNGGDVIGASKCTFTPD